MQLNKEYKMDNLTYKFYPNLLNLNFLLLEYWQEDNNFWNVFIIISLDLFLEYLNFTVQAVQFSCYWSVKSHGILLETNTLTLAKTKQNTKLHEHRTTLRNKKVTHS